MPHIHAGEGFRVKPVSNPDRTTLGAFGVLVLIGGINFVAVRFSNRELPPLLGAGARFAVAALVLAGLMAMRRSPLPRGRALKSTVTYGLLTFTVAYALGYWALRDLSAGIGAVIFGATPLFTVLLAAVHGLEKLTARAVAGSLLAVAGIMVLADPGADAAVPTLPLLAMLASAVATAEAGVLLKVVPPGDAVATNTVAMAVGAAGLLCWSLAGGESWAAPVQASTWISFVYLAVPGSAGLFALYLFTLERWTATAVSYMAALFPVVAVVAGAAILDEAVTWRAVAGGAVVILAVYVGALRETRETAATPR